MPPLVVAEHPYSEGMAEAMLTELATRIEGAMAAQATAMDQRFMTGEANVGVTVSLIEARLDASDAKLADALAHADLAVVPEIADAGKVAVEDRLDPEKLIADVKAQGTEAWYLSSVEEIAAHVAKESKEGDVVAVLSNGGFGGLHDLLLKRLAER